jgi:hypothetical protein
VRLHAAGGAQRQTTAAGAMWTDQLRTPCHSGGASLTWSEGPGTAQIGQRAPLQPGQLDVLQDAQKSEVTWGENAGETLRNDHVVRLYNEAPWTANQGQTANTESTWGGWSKRGGVCGDRGRWFGSRCGLPCSATTWLGSGQLALTFGAHQPDPTPRWPHLRGPCTRDHAPVCP